MIAYEKPEWKENPDHIASEIDYYEFDKIIEYDRVFIKGFAGSGKSKLIKDLMEYHTKMGIKFGYVAFTHTASNNICTESVRGQTAHSFFGMNGSNKISEGKFHKLVKEYQGIIVDEINQLPLSLLRVLCMLPKEFKIYAFGDHRQELPVEPHLEKQTSYLDTDMFKELMHRNLIVLK
jgi:hypothetical protein